MCYLESCFSQHMLAPQILMNGIRKNSNHIEFLKRIFYCQYFRLRSVAFILDTVILHMDTKRAASVAMVQILQNDLADWHFISQYGQLDSSQSFMPGYNGIAGFTAEFIWPEFAHICKQIRVHFEILIKLSGQLNGHFY